MFEYNERLMRIYQFEPRVNIGLKLIMAVIILIDNCYGSENLNFKLKGNTSSFKSHSVYQRSFLEL